MAAIAQGPPMNTNPTDSGQKQAPASPSPSTAALVRSYMLAIEDFKSWTSHLDDSQKFPGIHLDLESLNLYLYQEEIESLYRQLKSCTDANAENLVQKLRSTLRVNDEYFRNTRDKRNQDDIVRKGLRKIIEYRCSDKTGLIVRQKAFSDRQDMFARYLIANIGGATLLIPMIIMAFSKSRAVHLIVTSVFVLGFAFLVSVGARASNQELLGATAAYAAVLVVYVGASSP